MTLPRKTLGFLGIITASALLITSGLLTTFVFTVWAAGKKLQGGAPGCDWSMIAGMYSHLDAFSATVDRLRATSARLAEDAEAKLELIAVGDQQFWAPSENGADGARVLVSYLVAEHEFAASHNVDSTVQPGDIVIDCGAHIGVFTKKALALGAAKVIAIDPGPQQNECLRRNLKDEIASGRVILVSAGVWNEPGSMTMYLGSNNSGMGSLIEHKGLDEIEVPVTTIDLLVQELGLPRVDMIKLDIEGAEREALAGAQFTLQRFHPRLMIDNYYRRPEDEAAIPQGIDAKHADYRGGPSACEPQSDGSLAPHFAFYQ